jgi:cytochrome c oxidase subunit IV
MSIIPPELRPRLRIPLTVTAVLLSLLAVNGILGTFFTHSSFVWIPEGLIAATMIATVILFAMEVVHEPPIIRLFSGLGFFWVAILFGLTILDYLTR